MDTYEVVAHAADSDFREWFAEAFLAAVTREGQEVRSSPLNFNPVEVPSICEFRSGTAADAVRQYVASETLAPLFIEGDACHILGEFPAGCLDCCMTSPPYWSKREYGSGGIGLEDDHQQYISSLLAVFSEVRRILKPTGSFWLNVGDTYRNKGLLNVPWRIAIAMCDQQGWILRNTVIWNKVKGGPDNTNDRLRNLYEPVFHFVKSDRDYFYDVDAIRTSPRQSHVVNGAVVSATGVTGVRYRRQIELSTALTEDEKVAALDALRVMLAAVERDELSDFRMIIRGQQRTTHSDGERVSGRARELRERGFYFLKYHPRGSKPGDVWDIIPEDTHARDLHFAPYPEDLCKIPILATCPTRGMVLDPFCGVGTTMYVARRLERKSIGIDLSRAFLSIARSRCS